jgi:pimeloyl-ACP methyl ester carboxylesterase
MIRYLAMLLAPLLIAAPVHAKPRPFASERISVEVRGKGPDVVLIPGLSSSPEVWNSTVAAVPGYRYHLVHVSGFAGRPAGANGSGPVVGPVAEEIARYIGEAHLKKPAIVGHSLGGTLAMMVAARHPALASKVMVVDMMPFMGAMFAPNATPDSVKPVAEQIRTGIMASAGPAGNARVEQTIAGMIKTESLRPLAVRHSLESAPAVSGQAFYDLIVTDLRPELKNVRVPFTVLWVLPPTAPLTLAQMTEYYRLSYANVPQARLVNVPNSYHFIMWDAPDAFRAELKRFLAK